MLKTLNSIEGKISNEQTIAAIDSNLTDTNSTEHDLNFVADLNYDTIVAYLRWKFPDREHNENKKWVNLLIADLNSVGVKSYYQIEKIINDNFELFCAFEKANPPSNTTNNRFSDIGVMRIILSEKLNP